MKKRPLYGGSCILAPKAGIFSLLCSLTTFFPALPVRSRLALYVFDVKQGSRRSESGGSGGGPPYLHGGRLDSPRRPCRQLLQPPTLQACNCYHCQPQTLTVEMVKANKDALLGEQVAEERNSDESRKAETTTWQKRLIFGGDFEG
jgi:hypothetical protein